MGLFEKKIGPVFLKETSDAEVYIGRLQALLENADGRVRSEIEKQIKLAEYGEVGERNVAYELKNSGMDMYVLHDIYLETGDLSAQIDYIVVTKKHIYVIECKNLIGNIEIDNMGNFIRTYELFGRRVKEGIYSPITQNQRHLQVLKEIGLESRKNFLSKKLYEKYFDETYRSVVVLANPKTYLNMKYAKKEIKQQVIRADQLISYIRETDRLMQDYGFSEKDMLGLANAYLQRNVPERADYVQKYEVLVQEMENAGRMMGNEPGRNAGVSVREECAEVRRENVGLVTEQSENKSWVRDVSVSESKTEDRSDDISREKLIKELRSFRMDHSRLENIKPYYIFNDAQMMDLIEKKPRTKEELLGVSGFGKVKVEKYGEGILRILGKYYE